MGSLKELPSVAAAKYGHAPLDRPQWLQWLPDLILIVEQCGPSVILNSVACTISRIDGHALLEAVGADFGFAAFFPGWYGNHSAVPVHILTIGEHHECMAWLPIEQADKHRIIPHLHISTTDKMLYRLSA